MKTSHILIPTLLAVLPLAGLRAAAPAAGGASVQVQFFEPTKFTDIKESSMGSDRDGESRLTELRDYLVHQGPRYLAAGQKLEINFTDIDLAGEFEPWRGPRWMDVRVVKDLYPPRLVFSFRLTDAEGNVLKQGQRDLRDLAFLMKITMAFASDPVRHEKALLDDWLRDEFPRPAKG